MQSPSAGTRVTSSTGRETRDQQRNAVRWPRSVGGKGGPLARRRSNAGAATGRGGAAGGATGGWKARLSPSRGGVADLTRVGAGSSRGAPLTQQHDRSMRTGASDAAASDGGSQQHALAAVAAASGHASAA